MTKFIAVCNRRGGVGKTTITMMLAYGLSVARRQKVLLLDLDAQASTSVIMMGHHRWRTARDAHRMAAGPLDQIGTDKQVECQDFISRTIGDVVLADGETPVLDIIPSSHDLDEKEVLLMIAHQARFHKISDTYTYMQKRMGEVVRSSEGAYDQVIIDCAPGLSQLVWGVLRIADLVLIPYFPDRTAEDNVGWFANRLKEAGGPRALTVTNRIVAQDRRAQGIVAAVSAKYPVLGVQIPSTLSLASALDHREGRVSLAAKFGPAVQHVNALTDAVLGIANERVAGAAE